MINKLNVLLVGGGGREYALAWKISESPILNEFYSINSSDHIGIKYAKQIDIDYSDFDAIYNFCIEKKIDLIVIGPEKHIEAGLSDFLISKKINVFAPSKAAAQIESSKNFTKKICDEEGIPTAKYVAFNFLHNAENFVKSYQFQYPFVIKYEGLADGKGVKVVYNEPDALKYLNALNELYEKTFHVVIEEFLTGRELSAFFLCDGKNIKYLASARDYKRAYDGDKGDNTGGMGVICGDFLIDEELKNKILMRIVEPTLKNLKKQNIIFKGVIFAGLMVDDKNDPYLIEFNARFGDPETEAICMRLESDLLDILHKTATGDLKNLEIRMSEKKSLCVVLASNGYPGKYEKMKKIDNIPDDENDIKIFFHGAKIIDGECFSNGGRVLSVNIIDDNIEKIRDKAYKILQKINWKHGFYRNDIGT